ncbi:hypothetical protein GGD38_005977 [Chitinophagaceae bacterium OAS944]|nr:hypothetical protein [Chitinophagaceae bacterium OAS944]
MAQQKKSLPTIKQIRFTSSHNNILLKFFGRFQMTEAVFKPEYGLYKNKRKINLYVESNPFLTNMIPHNI